MAADARPRIGWYYGWNIVALAVLSQMAGLGLPLNSFSLFLRDWHRDFGASVSSLTLAVTIFSLACTFLCAIAGWAADKFPARWLLGGGLAMMALFHAAVGFTTAGWQIVALYAAASIGVTISSSIPAQALVSRWFVRRRGLALGLSALGISLSGVVFPPLVVWMLRDLGWRETWWLFAAVIGLAVVPIVVFGVRDRPGPGDSPSYLVGHEAASTEPAPSLKDIVLRPNFWIVGCVFICVFCVYQSVVINLAPIVTSRGLSLGAAGLLISALSVADLIGKVGAGALADRLGNRTPLVLVCLIAAAGAGLLAVARGAPALLIGLLLIGVAGAIWTLLASTTAAEFGPRGFGRAFGLICTFTPFGSMAPPVLAWTEERTGSYAGGLAALAVVGLVGAALAMMLKDRTAHTASAEAIAEARPL